MLKGQHTQAPRVVTVDKNAAYPVAIEVLKEDDRPKGRTEAEQVFE
jgi:hypothetical protein